MRQTLGVIAAVLALVISSAGASALDASKVAAINKAADSFVALAKDSAKTGRPPRQSDPGAKPLLDIVLDTTEIQSGPPQPMSALVRLNAWNLAVVKVGLVYILAGTNTTDIASLPNTPEVIARINRNTVEFAPEMGRYIDAQLWVEAAIIDTVSGYLATASKADLDRPNTKSGLAKIRSGAARTISGAITTLPTEGLNDPWRRDRLPALAAIGPKAAKFLLPEDVRALQGTATEVAAQMTDPAVKAGLASFAATLAPR
jgi:hypothetical protein